MILRKFRVMRLSTYFIHTIAFRLMLQSLKDGGGDRPVDRLAPMLVMGSAILIKIVQ